MKVHLKMIRHLTAPYYFFHLHLYYSQFPLSAHIPCCLVLFPYTSAKPFCNRILYLNLWWLDPFTKLQIPSIGQWLPNFYSWHLLLISAPNLNPSISKWAFDISTKKRNKTKQTAPQKTKENPQNKTKQKTPSIS